MKESSQALEAELEAIIAWFESEEADIDLAAEKYERGLLITEELKARLKQSENKITKLKQKFSD